MYELYLLLHPKYSGEQLEERIQEITAVFGQRGINLVAQKKEQSKELAYPIETHKKAHAVLFSASVEPGVNIDTVAQELLDTQEDILRRLVFKKEGTTRKKQQEATVIDQIRKERSPRTQETQQTTSPSNSMQDSPADTEKPAEESKDKEPDTAEIDKKLEELLQ